MEPPIVQCTVGHHFCKECSELFCYCAKCFSPKAETRNYFLEQLYFKVNLPCKYACYGCEFKCKSDKLKDHEAICTYTLRICPFIFTSLCSWNGIIYDIEEHCDDLHHCNVLKGSENKNYFFNFDIFKGGYSMFMIFALNSLFRLTLYVDDDKSMLKFSTSYLGQKLDNNRYSYEVKFLKNGTDKAAITLKAVCPFLNDHTKPFAGHYLTMPVNVLEPFCDNNGDLVYVIKIIDNGENSALSQPSTSKMSL